MLFERVQLPYCGPFECNELISTKKNQFCGCSRDPLDLRPDLSKENVGLRTDIISDDREVIRLKQESKAKKTSTANLLNKSSCRKNKMFVCISRGICCTLNTL